MVSGSSTLTAAAAVPLLYLSKVAPAAHFAGATAATLSALYYTGNVVPALVAYAVLAAAPVFNIATPVS